MVNAGACIDVVTADGRSALTMAAAFNRVEMIAWLLDRGAMPDLPDGSGARPVEVAKAMGAAEAVIMLTLPTGSLN